MKVINGGKSAANGKTKIYIGRGTPFGNPFHLHSFNGDRIACLKEFKAYFYSNPYLMQKSKELLGKTLVCHCKPQLCHGDIIAEYLEQFEIKQPTLF